MKNFHVYFLCFQFLFGLIAFGGMTQTIGEEREPFTKWDLVIGLLTAILTGISLFTAWKAMGC